MKMLRPATFLLLLCMAVQLRGQIQRSNIYLFNMEQTGDNSIRLSAPRWLTAFNPDGYNNHPVFIENYLLYISSQLPYQAQPDIIALNLNDLSRTKITATEEGEYSPARMPDFYNFSAVRLEFNGKDTLQRLWQFPVRRQANDNGKPIFKYLTDIGYYHWLNMQQVAIYQLGDPPRLGIAEVSTDQVAQVATDIGRTFRTLPTGNLVYLQKSNFGPWQLMEVDLRNNNRISVLADALPGSEDFVILNDGTILMGRGSKLFKFRPPIDEGWQEVADLNFYSISSISRLAVSQDGKLAIVGR